MVIENQGCFLASGTHAGDKFQWEFFDIATTTIGYEMNVDSSLILYY